MAKKNNVKRKYKYRGTKHSCTELHEIAKDHGCQISTGGFYLRLQRMTTEEAVHFEERGGIPGESKRRKRSSELAKYSGKPRNYNLQNIPRAPYDYLGDSAETDIAPAGVGDIIK